LRTPPYVAEYRRRSKGIQESRMRLYDDYFLDIPIPVPPKEEQQLILNQKSEDQINLIIEKEQTRSTLLKEYRQSLISSFVTGKVRVSEDML
jgi:type I restriction enzyme S subunit